MGEPHESSGVRASTAIVSLVLNAGVSVEELAIASGIPLDALRTPTIVDYDVGMRLWAAAERLTGDPYVGLVAGERMATDQVGVVGTAFAHSATLHDGLFRLASILPLIIQGAEIALATREDGVAFTYRSPRTLRHGVDAMFAAVLTMARSCAGVRIVPRAVELQAAPPESSARYVSLFGTLPIWERPVSALAFASVDLARPFRGAAPEISTLLTREAPVLLRAADVPHVSARVAEAIEHCLVAGDASAAAVARRLGWSARTLQRRLLAEGETLSAVRSRVLASRARALLSQKERTIDEVSEVLGFSSRSSFERAYRRWTGSSPARDRGATPVSRSGIRRGGSRP